MRALYNSPTAKVKINGELSDAFKLERSTRQGCPLSPLLFAIFIEPLAERIRQNGNIKGINITGSEQKLALLADDILVYLSKPTESLMELMSVLKEYGLYSGYKLNIQKTQVLSSFYSPPQNLLNKYKLSWDKRTIKYLGINLSMDITSLEEINYPLLKKDIMLNISRWSI